jgi:gamma-glutamyltranspeptidase/glutathione hydrolase
MRDALKRSQFPLFYLMRTFCVYVLAYGFVAASVAWADAPPILSPDALHHPVAGTRGVVATQEARATRIGIDILQRGGNAVDAAVGVGFALAVTLPRAGNLGGGGFMLIHLGKTGETVAIDYRETAPKAAKRDTFLGPDGAVDRERFHYSHKAAGVPGTVAGLALALSRYGTMPLKDLLAPAIRLAGDGILVTDDMARQLVRRRERLGRWPATKKIFLKPDGMALKPGERLIQRDLAQSLREIADTGPESFYQGKIATRIVAAMKAQDGLITARDLAAYRAVIRKPVHGRYRDYDVLSMPPPSSGGIHIVQILNILGGFDLAASGHNSAATLHLMAEAMKRAYADRSQHLGDPEFWQVPQAGLVSKRYAATLRKGIDAGRATPSKDIAPGKPPARESRNTTHFTVADRFGNVVSNTYTLNFSYGSGIVVPGTGILLNNEMADFSAKPGVPNAYGLLGGAANAVAGGKRPLSSMSPTIVLKDGKPFLATGSPGGSRIITTVLQVLLNVIDHGMNIAEATNAPRIHHQWLPDTLRVEKGLSPDTLRLLRGMGHGIRVRRPMGSVQSIMWRDGRMHGASDPRRPGALTLGY